MSQRLRDLVAAYRAHAPSAVNVTIEKIEAELKAEEIIQAATNARFEGWWAAEGWTEHDKANPHAAWTFDDLRETAKEAWEAACPQAEELVAERDRLRDLLHVNKEHDVNQIRALQEDVSRLERVRRVAASIAIDQNFGPKLPGLRAALAACEGKENE